MAQAGVGSSSNFIVNIQELQNVINSASGLTPFATLSQQITAIQEMVKTDTKQIAVNSIAAYNTTPIQVLDSMNFATGTTLTVGGTDLAATAASGGSTTYGTISSIGNVSSFTNYYSTTGALDTAIAFQVGSPPQTPLEITGGGGLVVRGGLTISGAGTPGLGKYLTCMDAGGTAEWQVPAMPSDARLKTNIQPLREADRILTRIRGVRFQWVETGEADIGVLAQDLLPVLPEAVVEPGAERPYLVAYQKIVPVLVEALKGLDARVRELEALSAIRQ
jgi:hypothetical protein